MATLPCAKEKLDSKHSLIITWQKLIRKDKAKCHNHFLRTLLLIFTSPKYVPRLKIKFEKNAHLLWASVFYKWLSPKRMGEGGGGATYLNNKIYRIQCGHLFETIIMFLEQMGEIFLMNIFVTGLKTISKS